MRNGLMVQVGGANGIPSPMDKNKSPSFHSNMSVDGNMAGNVIASPGSANLLLNDEAALIKMYEDHWLLEKIVLERVSLKFFLSTNFLNNWFYWFRIGELLN